MYALGSYYAIWMLCNVVRSARHKCRQTNMFERKQNTREKNVTHLPQCIFHPQPYIALYIYPNIRMLLVAARSAISVFRSKKYFERKKNIEKKVVC